MFQKLQTMKKNKKKGFTLIELIVVIAILAILAMLAVPQYQSLRDESAKAVAESNAHSVYMAAMAVNQIDGAEAVTPANVAKFAGGDIKTENIEAASATDDGKVSVTWTGKINGKTYKATYDQDGQKDATSE